MADEKYISKIRLPDGDTYALKDNTGHTHTLSIATSTGTTQLALAANKRYVITAGGSSFIFTTPQDKDTTYTAGSGLDLSGTEFKHSNSVTAQNTQGLYPITIDSTGHIASYGSRVTNIVNTITTTAGQHSAISSQHGNVSFKVPTHLSHLQNDTGFITSSDLDYYLKLTGGTVTGNTSFTSSVSITDLSAGQLVVSGSASVANNLQVSTINGHALSTAKDNNSIAVRTANGYLYASYLNQSSGAETPTTSSYIMYANSDGFLRKATLANIKSILGLGSNAYTSTAYLPLAGGTMTGDLLFSDSGTNTRQIRGIAGVNDYWRIAGGATASNAGWMEIATADDGNEPIYVRQYSGAYTTIKRTLTLLDANGDSHFPGSITVQKTTAATNTYADANPKVIFSNSDASQNISLTFSDYDSVQSPASLTLNGNQGGEYFIAPNIKATTRFYGPLTGDVTGNASTATTSSKLGTSDVGNSTRGIYLNDGVATALSWYPNYCTINGGNTANYPWHRFATCTTGTGQWVDRDVIVAIRSRYIDGPYGIVKLSVRTNATNAAMNCSATWIIRYGFAVGDVIITPTSGSTKTGTDTRFNAYIKCATYPRRYAYILEGSNNGWSLVSSNEVNDTTATDPKTSTEVNKSVTGTIATDGGIVNHANGADTCSYPAGFTSRSTGVTWGNTTGTSFTSWNTTNSGAIDFRYDNPSTGKLSIKVDGRFYFNEGNTPAAGLKSANSYWGLTGPDGEDNIWIRGTSLGFIPYQSGSAGSGHGSIGTSGWYWSNAYIDTVHGNATSATKATQDGSGNTITSTYLKLSGGTLSGAVNFANNTYNKMGDDAQIGDANQAGKIAIKGLNGATGIYFAPYSGSTAQTITIDGAGAMTISGTVKIEKIDSLNSNYKTINCDVSQAEVKAQNSNLTTSSADTDWFQALVKAICVKYPNISSTVFKGVLSPNSVRFYEIYIYNTSAVDSTTKLPQHSFGRALNYAGGFTKFGTDSYTWRFSNVDSNTTYSSLAAASGGTAVSLVTTGEKYTWNNKAPAYQYSTTDLTAGSSNLATGTLYFVYV